MAVVCKAGIAAPLPYCAVCVENVFLSRSRLGAQTAHLSGCRSRVQPMFSGSISPRRLLRAAAWGKTNRITASSLLGTLGMPTSHVGDEDGAKKQENGDQPIQETLVQKTQRLEELIERVIFNCRFFTIMAVFGSLAGSLLCFFKGSLFIVDSYREYFVCQLSGLRTGKVILLLVEAVDVYLMGTVMLIFGMGLYELFVSSLEIAGESCEGRSVACGSNLFGLFQLRERPKWLEIRSLDELKTKLGHVIVMILLVGMFEKSKKVPVNSGLDLLCFATSIFLASGCLVLLSKLNKEGSH